MYKHNISLAVVAIQFSVLKVNRIELEGHLRRSKYTRVRSVWYRYEYVCILMSINYYCWSISATAAAASSFLLNTMKEKHGGFLANQTSRTSPNRRKAFSISYCDTLSVRSATCTRYPSSSSTSSTLPPPLRPPSFAPAPLSPFAYRSRLRLRFIGCLSRSL